MKTATKVKIQEVVSKAKRFKKATLRFEVGGLCFSLLEVLAIAVCTYLAIAKVLLSPMNINNKVFVFRMLLSVTTLWIQFKRLQKHDLGAILEHLQQV